MILSLAFRFTRIPVHTDDQENLTGYVRKDEVLLARVKGEEDRTLASMRRPLTVVPESLPLATLFEGATINSLAAALNDRSPSASWSAPF